MRIQTGLIALALSAIATVGAIAAPTAELLRLFDGFAAHRRAADGYLRTGNSELGVIEIERLEARWKSDLAALPPALVGELALAQAMAQVSRLIADGMAAAERGDSDSAQQALAQATETLRQWRLARGLRLFSDCITEISAVYSRLDRYRVEPPDLDAQPVASDIAEASRTIEAALRKCDSEAPDDLARQPEFRRLVDGMVGSLRQVPQALRQRDQAYLYRLLIEQRSFERLLVFRFG